MLLMRRQIGSESTGTAILPPAITAVSASPLTIVTGLTSVTIISIKSNGAPTTLVSPSTYTITITASSDLVQTSSLSVTSSSRSASQVTQTSAANPSATTAKAGSNDVAAIAAGVTVPVVILSLILVGFLLFRRNKKRRGDEEYKKQLQKNLSEAQLDHEKPELEGGPHDASVAGPVRARGELHSKFAQTGSEAVGPDLLTATQSSVSELEAETSPYELGLGSLRDRERQALIRRSEQTEFGPVSSSKIITSPSQRSKTAATAANEAEQYDADLIAEADDLVQELGLITSRKRRLEKSALTTNTKPEDVEGSKGEDYRELLRREERLRRRMEEIAEERSGTG